MGIIANTGNLGLVKRGGGGQTGEPNTSFSIGTRPQGLAYLGDAVMTQLSADLATIKSYTIDPTHTLVDTISVDTWSGVGDITYDGTNLIFCDATSDTIYITDALTGTVTSSFASPALNPFGITIANGDLVIVCNGDSKTYVMDGISSSVQFSFTSPGTNKTRTYGVAFDTVDGNLILSNWGDNLIWIMDGISGSILSSFPTAGTNTRSLMFDSLNLWSADWATGLIYIHDGVTAFVP